jgi:hypothetical protein
MKYRVIHKKYLAEALSFLGFKYYKFNEFNQDNKQIIKYSFIETEEFNDAVSDLLMLKQKFNNSNNLE